MVRRTGSNPLVSILSQSPRSCAGAGSPGGFCGLAVDVAGWLAELVGPASVAVELGAAARRQPGRAEHTDQDDVDSHERMVCRRPMQSGKTLPVALGLPPEQPSDDGAEELVWRD